MCRDPIFAEILSPLWKLENLIKINAFNWSQMLAGENINNEAYWLVGNFFHFSNFFFSTPREAFFCCLKAIKNRKLESFWHWNLLESKPRCRKSFIFVRRISFLFHEKKSYKSTSVKVYEEIKKKPNCSSVRYAFTNFSISRQCLGCCCRWRLANHLMQNHFSKTRSSNFELI